MLALQIGDDSTIGLIDVAEPRLEEPTDVLVRVTTTTICGGDVHLRHGGILGAGPSWGGFGGSHAEHLRVPFADRTTAKVPDSLADEQVLLVGDVLAPGDDPVAAVLAATGGREPDVVIECAGAPATLRAAVAMVRPGGRIAVIGNPGAHEALPLIDIFNRAVTYSGGLARLDCLPELVALIEAGRLDLRPMITHRFELGEIVDGFELFESRRDGVIKVAVGV